MIEYKYNINVLGRGYYMWTRAELKEKAKLNVKVFYWKSVLVALILMLITGSNGGGSGRGDYNNSSSTSRNFFNGGLTAKWIALILGLAVVVILVIVIVSLAFKIFLLNPIVVGCRKYFLDASMGNADLNNLTYSFKSNYMNIVKAIFLRDLFIFLWTLLLIIPGIIKAYQYRMIPYILSENPHLSFKEAKERSFDIMDGEKWNTFVLDLSFILWHILSLCTIGIIGFFWVNPYVAYTDAQLYITLTNNTTRPNNNTINNNDFNSNDFNNNSFNNNNFNNNDFNSNDFNNNEINNNDTNNNDMNNNEYYPDNPYYDNNNK